MQINVSDKCLELRQTSMYCHNTKNLIQTIYDHDLLVWKHSENVAGYAGMVADKMNLPLDSIKNIIVAGLLHDIGKTTIDKTILNKSGKLTMEEYNIVKNHASAGRQIIFDAASSCGKCSYCPGLKDIMNIVHYHHEWFNGNGYPHGLKKDNIPLPVRIISVCDSFDAMIAKRSYKERMPIDHAITELKRCAGTQFDPNVVNNFIKCVEKHAI